MAEERANDLWERFYLLDNEAQNDIWTDSNASSNEELVEYLDEHWR